MGVTEAEGREFTGIDVDIILGNCATPFVTHIGEISAPASSNLVVHSTIIQCSTIDIMI